MITLEMKSDKPETGYIYIKYSGEINKNDIINVFKVDKFVEKPNEERAKKYIEN